MGQPTSNRLQWLMGAAGVLMFAGAVWVAVARRPSEPPPSAGQPVPAQTPPVAMFVQHDGAALRLHWNPDSAPIQRASSGALVISDGPRHSRLDLSPAELRSGVASYWPESSGVDFKLELDGAVAGELHAPALIVREEPRPSPFSPSPRVNRAARRPSTEDSDAEMPKPHTERVAGVRSSGDANSADRNAEPQTRDAKPAAAKPSRWNRVTGKIPLLRRLHRH